MKKNMSSVEKMFEHSANIVQKRNALHISFEEIIKYGSLHGIRKYTSLNQASIFLPTPEFISDYGFGEHELVYGDIAFKVQNDIIYEIEIPVYCDCGGVFGGDECTVDYWDFEDYEDISLMHVQAVLSNEGISYSVDIDDEKGISIYIQQSGATLCFGGNGYTEYDYTMDCLLDSIVL